MKKEDDLKLVKVFAGELWQATMIKNILEDNNIHAFTQNSLMGVIDPSVVSPGGFEPVKVIVANPNYDKAMLLVEEYNSSKPLIKDK